MSSAPQSDSDSVQTLPQQQQSLQQAVAAPPTPLVNGKLSFDDISKFFNLPIADAASLLGVCTSVLKRICRENGLIRWPYRKFLAGKTVEEIKTDAVKEKTRALADFTKTDKQKIDIPKMLSSSSVVSSSSFGNPLQNRTPGVAQEISKLQQGVSASGSVLQPHGNKFLQHGVPNTVQANQTRSIPTYFDDFKYGFPAKGLSSISFLWWGSRSSESIKKTKEEEKQDSSELSNEMSTDVMIDDQSDSNRDNAVINWPSSSLLALRKRAAEHGRQSLKVGISEGCESSKLGKRQRLLLVQVFKSSLPDQWKDTT